MNFACHTYCTHVNKENGNDIIKHCFHLQQRLPADAKKILQKEQKFRSEKDIEYVSLGLRFVSVNSDHNMNVLQLIKGILLDMTIWVRWSLSFQENVR